MKNILKFLSVAGLISLTACVTNQWQTTSHIDEFTNAQSCRVQFGADVGGSLVLPMAGYLTQYFYAERNNGEVRVGVRSEPPVPINGDVQIKVGERLYVLTTQDVPLDVAPSIPTVTPEEAKVMPKGYGVTLNSMAQNVQRISSPYRAYTGGKAEALLRDILATGGVVKFRTIGVNTQTSSTGSFVVDDGFRVALAGCGINP